MAKENRIFVLGSFIVDLAFRCPGLPEEGETIRSHAFVMGPGGKGTNQAIAAQRSGGQVTLLTAVGSDHLAKVAESVLEQEGIGTRYLQRFGNASTGVAFIHVDSITGQNRIIVYTGANELLRPDCVRLAENEIRGARVFLTQLEQPIETAAAGLALARSHGVTTILNPAPALPLGADLLAFCDLITPNESEAASITGVATVSDEGVRAAAARLREMGARNVVVTLGARGAYVAGEEEGFVEAFSPPSVVDTTGAGDAFNGAMAVALAEGRSLKEAVRNGCAAGALCVSAAGTAPAMPHAAAVAALRNAQQRPLPGAKL
ncbi:MAG: ribokinase [Rhodobacteraceae bacterium]|nr:ribokinase [Paracoccaceae bacterium]